MQITTRRLSFVTGHREILFYDALLTAERDGTIHGAAAHVVLSHDCAVLFGDCGCEWRVLLENGVMIQAEIGVECRALT